MLILNYKSLYSDETYDYLLHLDGTATITKYNGKDRVVTIPQTVTFGDVEYTIEKIDDNAFNTNLRLLLEYKLFFILIFVLIQL